MYIYLSLLILNICIVCLHLCLCTQLRMCSRDQKREGTRSPGNGVTNSYELPGGAGNRTQFPRQQTELLTDDPSLSPLFLILEMVSLFI